MLYVDVVNGVPVRGPSKQLKEPYSGSKMPARTVKPSYDQLTQTLEGPNYKLVDDVYVYAHTVVDIPLEEIKRKLKAKAAERRYEEETKGTPIADTSRESQILINTAYTAVQIDPDATIDFEGKNGWEELGAEEVVALAAHVGKHVQDCRTNEKKNLVDTIDAAKTVEEALAVDMNSGWPTYG